MTLPQGRAKTFRRLARRLFAFLERRRWPHVRTHYDWAIGIYEGTSPLSLRPPPNVTNPVLTAAAVKDVHAEFVADPFIVPQGDRWHMFFEVMNGTRGRGEIGWATSNDGRAWKYQQIVLREPFHLSYPSVFHWEGEWFMIPESGEAKGLRLYRAEAFPLEWRCVATLLGGEFTDHALLRHEGLWWLFAGKGDGSDLEGADTLELYFAETFRGPWQVHPQSPVVEGDPRFSRPAGRVISTNAGLLRVTQDCSDRYGKEVNAALIEALTTTVYRERILEKPLIAPGSQAWHRRGMHHLDAVETSPDSWLAAVDGYRRRFSFHWR